MAFGFGDRLFTPVTTIWGFLRSGAQRRRPQVAAINRCRGSSRIVRRTAFPFARPIRPATARRGAIFRQVFCTSTTRTAEELQKISADEWKWNGRNVFIVDGSHVSMPDTDANQAVYPQPSTTVGSVYATTRHCQAVVQSFQMVLARRPTATVPHGGLLSCSADWATSPWLLDAMIAPSGGEVCRARCARSIDDAKRRSVSLLSGERPDVDRGQLTMSRSNHQATGSTQLARRATASTIWLSLKLVPFVCLSDLCARSPIEHQENRAMRKYS